MDSPDQNKAGSILDKWKNHQTKEQADSKVEPTQASYHFRASGPQQRIYFLQQLLEKAPVYNLTEIWEFNGPLNRDDLLRSFDVVIKKQDLLRSNIREVDGQIQVVVHEEVSYDFEFFDLIEKPKEEKQSILRKIAQQKSNLNFDLENGSLVNISLFKFEDDHHFLVVNVHHIISDKWSMQLMRNDLSFAYKQIINDPSNVEPSYQKNQYKEYVHFEEQNVIDEKHVDYWKEKLKGPVPRTSIPSDKEISTNASLKGKYFSQAVPPELFAHIKSFCSEQKMTSFAFFLSVFKLLVYKYTDQTDVSIGTPISTRSKIEFEKIIGFFNDTIVLRTFIEKEGTFLDFLTATKETVLKAFEYKSMKFDRLIEMLKPERAENINPFFSLMFLYHKEFGKQEFTDEISLDVENFDMGVSKFDLTLYVGELSDRFELTIEYATDLYSGSYIKNLASHYLHLVKEILNDPNKSIHAIQLFGDSEIDQLLAIGTGNNVDIREDFHLTNKIFAEANPNALAVRDQTKKYTYKELDELSDAIAQSLQEYSPDKKRVAILLHQSCDFIAAMLGALKSGYTYIPLDLEYPKDHINYVLEDAEVELIIGRHAQQPDYPSKEFIDISKLQKKAWKIENEISHDDIAYIIYTSGSTGKPKGAKISHGNLINSTLARFEYYDRHPKSYLLLSSLSFDSSVAGVYWTLMNGGSLIIPDKKAFNDLEMVSQLIIENNISHTLLIPSLYSAFLDYLDPKALNVLELVILAGERLPASVAEKHFQRNENAKLYNEYGPSEATVWASAHQVMKDKELTKIPIGKAIANTSLIILDKNLAWVPKGIHGELYIAGKSVCKNYIHSEKIRDEAFIWKDINGTKTRLYKTGDWVKWNENNELLFLGRKDRQLKIRGHRIELEEIDSVIQKYAPHLTSQTTFIAAQNELVSFLRSDQNTDHASLRSYLTSKLPKHYIPKKFVDVEEFPLLPNGKVDINALEKMNIQGVTKMQQAPKTNSIESNMLQIWSEVLHVPDLGIHDNYFEAGGDSIQIIRIIGRAKKKNIHIKVSDIYKYQTIHELNQHISTKSRPVEKALLLDKLAISPIQEWFFDLFKSDPGHWCLGFSFELQNPCSIDVFRKAISELLLVYPIFQVVFKKEHNKWFQVLQALPVDRYMQSTEFQASNFKGFDIENGPLCRFFLEQEEGLVKKGSIVAHHLIIDALSWDNLFGFLDEFISGKNEINSGQSNSYFKWIMRENHLASTSIYDQDIEHWTKAQKQPSEFLSNFSPSKEKDHETLQISFGKEFSQNLKSIGRQLSQLTVDEIIIACFMEAFHSQVGETSLSIMLERHGRKSNDTDLADSIGWHTSYFPVLFTLTEPGNIKKSIIDIKEQNRKTPNQGESYGILKYLSHKLTTSSENVIIINHLGDALPTDYAEFGKIKSLVDGMRSEESERHQLIEINSWFENGCLQLSFAYDRQLGQSQMQLWLDDLKSSLQKFNETCIDEAQMYTPSDYDFIPNSQELDKIIAFANASSLKVSSILPLTASQSALLFHYLQNPKKDQGLIHATTTLSGTVDPKKLDLAWGKMIKKHDVLRSNIYWNETERPFQLIYDQISTNIEFETKENEILPQALDIQSVPSYQLSCIKLAEEKHKLVLRCHHIFLDGWSTYQMMEELLHIYNQSIELSSREDTIKPSLLEWNKQFTAQTKNASLLEFWESYLKNAEPNLIKANPVGSNQTFNTAEFYLEKETKAKVEAMLKSSRLTLTTFISGIWAYLLSKYLDKSDVTIGLTHAGRSLDVENMEVLNGMFSTVLPLRIKHSKEGKIHFESIKNDLQQIMTRDAISLEDLQSNSKSLKLQLFDTLIVVENFAENSDKAEGLQMKDFKSQISTTLPLSIVIVPGEKLKISFRYDDGLFAISEIEDIKQDLKALITNIDVKEGVAKIETTETFRIIESASETVPANSNKIIYSEGMPLDNYLSKLWMEVLQSKQIQMDDNFFELGGTSIKAVRIFNQINKDLEINASPIVLLQNNTINKLSNWLQINQSSESWECLFPLKKTGDLPPLFCFHAGEGHILFYKDLADSMADNRPVYGIQSSGLDGSNQKNQNIEELAAYYLSEIKKKYPTGPYHLLGTCFSNAVTFEMAKILGKELGSLIIVDSPPPYFREFSKLSKWWNWVKTFNYPKLLEAANNYFKYSKLRMPEDEQEKNLFITGKYLRDLLSTYRWEPSDLEIVIIRSSQNADDPFKSYHIDNWQLLAKQGLQIKTIQGTHLDIFNGASAKLMAKQLNTTLRKNEL